MHTFPEIKVKATNFPHTPEIESVLQKRLATLEKFLPGDETALLCDAELEKLAEHQTGRVYRAEVNLQVGGELLRAEAVEERMEDAIDRVRDELKRELTKLSGKRQSVFRRGAARLKEMMRFGR